MSNLSADRGRLPLLAVAGAALVVAASLTPHAASAETTQGPLGPITENISLVSGSAVLQNKGSGSVGLGNPGALFEPSTSVEQRWDLSDYDSSSNSYVVRSASDSSYLAPSDGDVVTSSVADGARWTFVKQSNGTYQVQSAQENSWLSNNTAARSVSLQEKEKATSFTVAVSDVKFVVKNGPANFAGWNLYTAGSLSQGGWAPTLVWSLVDYDAATDSYRLQASAFSNPSIYLTTTSDTNPWATTADTLSTMRSLPQDAQEAQRFQVSEQSDGSYVFTSLLSGNSITVDASTPGWLSTTGDSPLSFSLVK
ncbi:hypothetical protein [Lysinibacter sp. HNR]|uniref:hypothetical protein n=1 Tax=Lysinibacter sp. HNR TaxID=3031408 RepID=UPI0024350F42|nr:hypothetical protein [Lysinibacter sp. HNR]WGD37792.1 hypothetical protein FrondiHNR_02440 [Lysinibacter sp. HNR]